MKISAEEVRYVARLARLGLEEDRVQQMSATLSEILTYINKLNELETTDVPPTAHIGHTETALREDTVRPSLPLEAALQNAPDRAGAFYRVPKIIES